MDIKGNRTVRQSVELDINWWKVLDGRNSLPWSPYFHQVIYAGKFELEDFKHFGYIIASEYKGEFHLGIYMSNVKYMEVDFDKLSMKGYFGNERQIRKLKIDKQIGETTTGGVLVLGNETDIMGCKTRHVNFDLAGLKGTITVAFENKNGNFLEKKTMLKMFDLLKLFKETEDLEFKVFYTV